VSSHILNLITVPLFTGAIGYVINWTGVWMLFKPLTFKGIRVPGVKWLVRLMPRKIQQIPGIMNGGIGWQGIIPSRAAKMGSIAVDKGIAKVGSPAEFYEQLDPEKIAEHILSTARSDMRDVVERIMERQHPQLWHDLPPRVREGVHSRVQDQLPDIVRDVTDEIGNSIDQLLDVKMMVISHIEANPEVANQIYSETGEKELRFIKNFGFWFGLALGIPLAFLTELVLTQWWALPVGGVLIGYATNWVAIWMIFEPVEERTILGRKVQGLFIKRQHEVSEVYARVVADEVITLNNIGAELLHGPRSDRTRHMIETAMRPAVDRAVGRTSPVVRVAVGAEEYDSIRESLAVEAVDYTMTPLADEEFNRQQSAAIKKMITERMREMSPGDFSEMLRTVMKEDEWLLYLHGAVLGFGGGVIHLLIFG
jgi:uncharacterized membrane protein YheB (UPF0754 family)